MKRSEVWIINLDPTLGAEIRKKLGEIGVIEMAAIEEGLAKVLKLV